MTRVVFYKSEDTLYGFDIQGHTGLADAGEDILCAAVSSLTMFVVNAAEQTYHATVMYTVDDADAHIFFTTRDVFTRNCDEKTAFAVAGLIGAYYKHLKMLEEEYPAHLHVTVKNKTVE